MVLLFFWLGVMCFSVQAQELPKGQIVEKVVCQSNTNYSYALYLPSNYTPEKRWPILYSFDPIARGSVPVQRFKEAAEKYGYIVVGSHNSRNGSIKLSEIVAALIEDTLKRFSINEQRVYATGFSGGARVACSVAEKLNGAITGVIACGAGFPPELSPSKNIPFIFFGTIGTEDFNFPELMQLDRTLESLSINHRVAVFEGAHSWAPKDLCTEAIEWMELQAMKAGRREKDAALITALWAKRLQRAKENEEAKKVYEAYLSYQSLADDFKGLRDVAEFENKANQLKSSKEVKAYLRQERGEEEKQRLGMNQFVALFEQIKSADNRTAAMNEIRNTITEWQKRANSKDATSDRLAARRLVSQFYAFLFEGATLMWGRKDPEQAVLGLLLASEIRPENPQIFYQLADAYAFNKQKRQALDALKHAVEKGFSNAVDIEQNQNFDALRNEAEYKQLIETIKQKK